MRSLAGPGHGKGTRGAAVGDDELGCGQNMGISLQIVVRAKIGLFSREQTTLNRTERVCELQITGRGVWIALTSAIFWAASLAAMLAGGYVVAVGTPCLCADVNGFMLGGGLVIILISAAMLLWSRELARLAVDRLTRLATQQK